MSTTFQTYKQQPGALDIDDTPMEPGWYWVRVREPFEGTLIPFGKSVGPFRIKRDAERDARRARV